MRSIDARIIRLEASVRSNCDVCLDWDSTVLIDGTGMTRRPETCPGCGREVPVEQIVELAGVALEDV